MYDLASLFTLSGLFQARENKNYIRNVKWEGEGRRGDEKKEILVFCNIL